ncbi:WEB family protein At1g75720 [Lactuca sativa]|uniref:WEB family protein At1g75720 n=1 Tax=Lactuca sativa TaxID=4236 RepID=UPI000CC4F80F|nr:WEB family protein At1g75720 [Lactuca sativa]
MDQTQTLPENQPPPPPVDNIHHSPVDNSRPFRSVKEAVAVFGERFLATEVLYSSPSSKPFTLPKQETPIWKSTPENEENPSPTLMTTLKKLESELEETKRELNILKERESETEVALASLNAELHKNMSKIAKAEAEVAGKAVAAMRPSTTLGQVLNGGGEREKGGERKYVKERKVMKKKKPVVPLVTDLFTKKNNGKVKSSFLSPFYSSSPMYNWN